MADNTLKRAEELFEAENYFETLKICKQLMEAGSTNIDLFLIMITANLRMTTPQNVEHFFPTTLKIYELALKIVTAQKDTETLQKFVETVHAEFKKAILRIYKGNLQTLEHNTVLFEEVSSNILKLDQVEIDFMGKDIRNRCGDFGVYSAIDSAKRELYFEAALTISRQTNDKFLDDFSLRGSKEYLIQLAKPILSAVIAIDQLMSWVIPESSFEKFDEKEVNEREQIIEKAKVYVIVLTQALYYHFILPNNVVVYLVTGLQRSVFFNRLLTYQRLISQADPSYTPPELPPRNVPEKGAANPSNTSSGCYVATAVYGSYDCPEVWTLRRFRDHTLANTWYGRMFIRAYYAVSPTLVKWFGHTAWFKNMWKPKLDKLVRRLNFEGIKDTPYNDRVW